MTSLSPKAKKRGMPKTSVKAPTPGEVRAMSLRQMPKATMMLRTATKMTKTTIFGSKLKSDD